MATKNAAPIKPHKYDYNLAGYDSRLPTKPLFPKSEDAADRRWGNIGMRVERSSSFNIGTVTFKGYLNDPADRKVNLTMSHMEFLCMVETIISFSNNDKPYDDAARIEWEISSRYNPLTGAFSPTAKPQYTLSVSRDSEGCICIGFKIPSLSSEISVPFRKPNAKLPKIKTKDGVVSDLSNEEFSNVYARAWAVKYRVFLPTICSTFEEPPKYVKPGSEESTSDGGSSEIHYDDLE